MHSIDAQMGPENTLNYLPFHMCSMCADSANKEVTVGEGKSNPQILKHRRVLKFCLVHQKIKSIKNNVEPARSHQVEKWLEPLLLQQMPSKFWASVYPSKVKI